jgi:hypothetical protein
VLFTVKVHVNSSWVHVAAALSLDKFNFICPKTPDPQVNEHQVSPRVRPPIFPPFSFPFPKLKSTNTTHLPGITHSTTRTPGSSKAYRNNMASELALRDDQLAKARTKKWKNLYFREPKLKPKRNDSVAKLPVEQAKHRGVTSPVSHTESCPLFRLPPELRLRVYYYTHQLRLDNKDHPDTSTETLNQSWASSWESTPLVQLAATCRLIASEVRPIVRSLPASYRVAHMELSAKYHDSLQVRLRHLPCPLVDLRHIVITYDVRNHSSAKSDLDAAMAFQEAKSDIWGYGFGYLLYRTLHRLMIHEALGKTKELESIQLRLTGVQRNGRQESNSQAVQRILDLHRPEGILKLAQEIIHCCRFREHDERDEVTLQLAVFNGRSLQFWCESSVDGCRDSRRMCSILSTLSYSDGSIS